MKRLRTPKAVRCLSWLRRIAPITRYSLVLMVAFSSGAYAVSSSIPTGPTAKQERSLIQRIVNFKADELSAQRERFLQAEKALRLRRTSQYRALLPTLTDYPLYPYLRYQELKNRLHTVSPDDMRQFLSDYEALPIAGFLRNKWLKLKARQGRWQQFLDFYTPQRNVRLQCSYMRALLNTEQTETAYAGIEKLWLTGKSQPRSCDRVFKPWKNAGKQTTELVWQRMNLALTTGHRTLARYLVKSLPNKEQWLARLWVKLHRKPHLIDKHQQRIFASQHTMAPLIFNNVIKRLARKSPQIAADIWFAVTAKHPVNTEEQYAMLQSFAISLARKQRPGAEAWFSIIPVKYLSNVASEWRVRSALRQSEWSLALTALNALTTKQQITDRWQYWRARVNDELQETTTAMAHYTALAQHRSYYGFLAADKLGLPYVMADRPHHLSAGELFEIGQKNGMLRAREFLHLNRMTQARREWRKATQRLSNQDRVNAAKLAQHWGWAEQSILTMASTDQRDDVALRFPLLFQDKVLNHSQQANINPAWAYGVIRRESAFVQDARSPKGALGLMQLLPSTAKSMSRNMPRKYRGKSRLIQSDANIALGTKYLSKMLKRFSGQTVLATAAYNAGARRIKGWLPKNASLDADRWIESIPFKETREYVTNVLAYTIIYADRLGIKQDRLTQRMPAIPTREAL
ncbi:MAG: transglycosylase SLT domain-containing protein [Ectothiorhodospiraceae bacterium]|nr:transglycosylase SLT domain-containing protein [Ectothiorhodospiraceae bacterium]